MPFTGAHPLAIVPLQKWRWLDATALVFGSMAPDFEYFAYGEERGNFGHTWLGLVAWCLPVTLILGVAWHSWVKWPLISAVPEGIARRVAGPVGRPWRIRPVAVAVSAVVGALTHDLWDSFTHADGLVVKHVAALRDGVDVPVVGRMVVHRMLQHGCSVVGLAALAWLGARWLGRQAVVELPAVRRGRAMAIVAACIAVGAALWEVRIIKWHFAHDIGTLVVAGISGSIAGILVASGVLRTDGKLLARSVSDGRDTTVAWHE